MRVTKQQPSTEIYNITIEGGEDRIEYAEGQETKSRVVEDPNSLSISSEIKTGSDSSSELPDDVKGMYYTGTSACDQLFSSCMKTGVIRYFRIGF